MTTSTDDQATFFGRDDEEEIAHVPTPSPTPSSLDSAPDSSRATLTLADIETLTGIPYVTLQRYGQQHSDRLPHEGTGRNRRYYPEAVEVFQALRGGAGTPASPPTLPKPRKPKPPAPSQPTQPSASRPSRRGNRRPLPAKKPRRGAAMAPASALAPAPPAPVEPASLQALRRAHLATRLEALNWMLDSLMGEHARIQAEIDRLNDKGELPA